MATTTEPGSKPQQKPDQIVEILNRQGGPPPIDFGAEPIEAPEPRVARWLVWLTLVGMAVVGSIVALFLFKGFYVDWLWYASVGFEGVYTSVLSAKILLFIGALVVAGTLLIGNVLLARRLAARRWDALVLHAGELLDDDGPRERARSRDISRLLIGIAAVVTLALAWWAMTKWDVVLRLPYASDFGVEDPLHGRDVGYYVFLYPVLQALRTYWLTILVLALLSALALYFARLVVPQAGGDGLRVDEETGDRRINLAFGGAVRRHLSLLGAGTFALLAWHYLLRLDGLVFSNRGTTFGAGYTDVNASAPVLWALVGVCALGALLSLAGLAVRGPWLGAAAVGILVPVWLIGVLVWPNVVQRLQVAPNELALETQYIERNILMTRRAYGLDQMQESNFAVAESVSREEVESNPATLRNIRLWDYEPLLASYNQLQSLRGYYGFLDADFDRYVIDGEYRQVMIAGRELMANRLPPDAQTWVNRRLQYTHGYGVAVSPVNEVLGEGLPSMLVQDVPPRGKIPVSRPEIYYGESGAGWVVVKSTVPEFDYPRGQANAEVTYQGTSGVGLGSFFRRVLFAWQLTDLNLLATNALTKDSAILFHRGVAERVGRVAPFLHYDSDPYLVIADGKLVWLIDAYTASGQYPYSQPVGRNVNYLRNSVKVAVDAYDGSMAFYVWDEQDPLARAYRGAFPSLFKAASEMPSSIRAHVRYPLELFAIQSQVYSRYHMQDPRVFYQREDQLVLPRERYLDAQNPVPVRPYYTIMRLPGEAREEFVFVQPYTPPGKDNMSTWLAARSDGTNYGKLVAFKYPKDANIFGPLQVEARIDQDPDISQLFTLWNQGGSRVLRGNMLAIPIGKSNLYVEPIYLRASSSQLPELKRVVVATGSRVAMGLNVDDALAKLYGGPIAYQTGAPLGAPPVATPGPGAAQGAAPPAAVTQPAPAPQPTAVPQAGTTTAPAGQTAPAAPAPAQGQASSPGGALSASDRQLLLDTVRSLQQRYDRQQQESAGIQDELRRLREALERNP
ncbi:MAG TPA: UPF0182 family protein [Chloroflexota bacterium]|nr:UPF0182 family protein [Chloroflexota bacterium]